MLNNIYSGLLEAKDISDLRSEVVRFAKSLEFDTVAAITVVEHGAGKTDFISIDNNNDDYLNIFNDESMIARCPVMQHCRYRSLPIIWDQKTYTDEDAGDLWETQARFGYRTGVCLALHMPGGNHFVLGVDRDKPLTSDVRQLQRVVADLQLFSVYARDTALRLLLPQPVQQPVTPTLTSRELDSLRWTTEGKTAWEVGVILNITERTAVMHLANATRKLNAVNKHAAAITAIRLGLIY